ncbi:MAG TPA: alpha-amylase/4-alpha-glucanotransferase domain-containing protein, partial [bacterium]|nr:alpha-amylase/4-alpha-glucanotransferase domain-containing protein [bacterium]
NLSDTLTRRKEAYHEKLLAAARSGGNQGGVASIHDMVRMKEPGLEHKLFYDPARRASLTEHFVPDLTTAEQMMTSRYQELGDFRTGIFDSKIQAPKKKGQKAQIRFSRLGKVNGQPMQLTKSLQLQAGDFGLEAAYELKNEDSHGQNFLFLVEWNLTLLAGNAPDRNYFVAGRNLSRTAMNSMGEEDGVTEMGMRDGWLELEINFKTARPAKFWRYPVETISQSEGGFEKVYQGSCLLLGWEVSLKPGETFKTSVATQLIEMKHKK